MWQTLAPGLDVVASMEYSANFYGLRAVQIIEQHANSNASSSSSSSSSRNTSSRPLFLYLAIQNVHSPYTLPPAWETKNFSGMWDHVYSNMISMLDDVVGNVTNALTRTGMWGNTLLLFTADNGGIGLGNNYPLRGHKHDPWQGGTRAAAFISGGLIPYELRGTHSGDHLIHISDWYATFAHLAGVDSSDPVRIGDDNATHDIDGVNVWPLLTRKNLTQPREMTPITESSLIWVDPANQSQWWKLITLAGQSNYYHPNQSSVAPGDPCLEGRQPDPAQPGRTDSLVTGCPVCNASHPCLYDILADPAERHNIAKLHPKIVQRLLIRMDKFVKYYVSGHLPPAVLEANYTKIDKSSWQGYLGPCYARKA